ncbi:MAG: hypothetical protein ACK4QW_03655 [Alphaproteobacteria bacterium]
MKKSRGGSHPPSLPDAMFDLSLSSWETILRRSLLIAEGRCTPTEYARMVDEKVRAAQETMAVLASPAAFGASAGVAMLAPWRRGARANARRLRRR